MNDEQIAKVISKIERKIDYHSHKAAMYRKASMGCPLPVPEGATIDPDFSDYLRLAEYHRGREEAFREAINFLLVCCPEVSKTLSVVRR